MPTIEREGLRLFFRDEGHGLPVLLLHAFPLTGEMFSPQFKRLGTKLRFIVPDLRGFGQTPAGPGPTEMSTLAKDALAILDALRIPAAVVGGVSMGGYAAMALTREDPGRVKALMLIDTHPFAEDEASRAGREETARAVEATGSEALVERFLPKLLSPEAPADLKAFVAAMIRMNPKAGAAAALRGMALRPDSREILSRFGGPALAVVGEKDPVTPPAKVRQMAELIAGARVVEIPGAGHLPNLEAPDAFNRALLEFLAPWM